MVTIVRHVNCHAELHEPSRLQHGILDVLDWTPVVCLYACVFNNTSDKYEIRNVIYVMHYLLPNFLLFSVKDKDKFPQQ
jgi:hypothetical protein